MNKKNNVHTHHDNTKKYNPQQEMKRKNIKMIKYNNSKEKKHKRNNETSQSVQKKNSNKKQKE